MDIVHKEGQKKKKGGHTGPPFVNHILVFSSGQDRPRLRSVSASSPHYAGAFPQGEAVTELV